MKTKASIFFAAVVLMFCAAISFVSCDKDDNGDDSGLAVYGSWTYSWENENITLMFSMDGKGVCNRNGYYSELFNYNTQLTFRADSETRGMITFKEEVDLSGGYSDFYERVYFEVEGSKLYLYDTDDYSLKGLILSLEKDHWIPD